MNLFGLFSKKSNTKNSAYIYLTSSICSFVISILSLPVLTRLLSPSEFGKALLFVIFGKLVVGLVNFNLHFSTYRYYFEYKAKSEKFRTLNTSNILFLLVVAIITVLVFNFLSIWVSEYIYGKQLSGNLLTIAIFSGFIDYLTLYLLTILTAQSRAISFAIITIGNMIFNSLFSILFILYYDSTFLGRIYGILLSQLLILLISVLICYKTFTLKFSINSLKKSLHLTAPMIPQMAMGLSQNYLDKTLLTYNKGVSSLGFYSLGINFATILKTIMDAIEKAWAPFFFTKAQEGTQESKIEIAQSFMFLTFVYMTLGLGIIYFSEEAIKLLTTKEYFSAIYVVPIYVYFYLFAIIGYISNAQLNFAKKIKYILPGTFVSAIVNISLNFLLIPKFGAIGASVSSAVTALINQIILYFFGMKSFPIPISVKKIIASYTLVILFTSFFYLLIDLDLHFISKIIIKLSLVLFFVVIGFWTNIISKQYISIIIGNSVFGNYLSKFLR